MDKGFQYLRFGTMSLAGAAGMYFFRQSYLFNLSALVFIVAAFIFLAVLIIPQKYGGRHIARRI